LDELIEDTKYYGLDVRRFCDSEAKLATLKFLRRQKIFRLRRWSQNTPDLGASRRGLCNGAPFFSESGWLSKCSVLANLNKQKATAGSQEMHKCGHRRFSSIKQRAVRRQ
jgi:hypothetical protein